MWCVLLILNVDSNDDEIVRPANSAVSLAWQQRHLLLFIHAVSIIRPSRPRPLLPSVTSSTTHYILSALPRSTQPSALRGTVK